MGSCRILSSWLDYIHGCQVREGASGKVGHKFSILSGDDIYRLLLVYYYYYYLETTLLGSFVLNYFLLKSEKRLIADEYCGDYLFNLLLLISKIK